MALPLIFTKQVQNRNGHAIRACSHGETDHVRFGQRLVIQLSELVYIRVGIRVGLEVGQVLPCPGALANDLPASSNLFNDSCWLAPVGAERHIITESAATPALAAINIGAGEFGINGNLVHALAITMQHGLTKGIDVL